MNFSFLHLSEPLDYPTVFYVSHGVRIIEVLLYLFFLSILSLSSCPYSTRYSHPDHQYLTVPPFHSNIFAMVLPLMLLRTGMNSLMMCAMQLQLPPSGKSSKLACLQKPIHHSLPCQPVSSWNDLAMSLDLFNCFVYVQMRLRVCH